MKLRKILRDSSKRENKYQETIEKLAEHLAVVDNIKEDVEEIKSAKDKLLEKANEFASKVYEEAAKANQEGGNASEDSADDSKDDDNVVDADYEEK